MSRILIADDEAIEIKALEMMIHLDFPDEEVLQGAVNGPDLITKIEQEKPDLVIADINMPGMSGLDALELIRARYPNMKIIISTAYSDFDYVKRALKMGASDYILKPVSRQAFSQTMQKVLSQLGSEREKAAAEVEIREDYGKMSRIVGEEFLASLLLGTPSEGSFEIYKKSLPGGYHGVIALTVRFVMEDSITDKNFYPEMEQSVRSRLEQYCHCIGKSYQDELYYLIFPNVILEEEKMHDWLRDMAHMVGAAMKAPYKDAVSFGFSLPADDAGDIERAMEQSRIAVRSHGKSGIWFYEEKRVRAQEDPLAETFSEMVPLIAEGNREGVADRITKAFEAEQLRDIPLDELKMFVLEDLCQVMDLVAGQTFEQYLPQRKIAWEAFTACASREQVRDWSIQALERQISHNGSAGQMNAYIGRALLFMEEHYAEDLSLEMTAQAAGISSFYLSRLFKQELKRTFVEVLTEIRLDQSLRMIREGTYTVREIASRTGYRSANYFYKVFKKYTGIGVGQLRDFWEGR